MGKVLDISPRIKDKRFDEKLEQFKEAVLIADLGSVWPDWESAFDEAAELEKSIGSEAALEVLRNRCPFDLDQKKRSQ